MLPGLDLNRFTVFSHNACKVMAKKAILASSYSPNHLLLSTWQSVTRDVLFFAEGVTNLNVCA